MNVNVRILSRHVFLKSFRGEYELYGQVGGDLGVDDDHVMLLEGSFYLNSRLEAHDFILTTR